MAFAWYLQDLTGSIDASVCQMCAFMKLSHLAGHCEENIVDTVLMLWNSRLLNGINWAFFLSVTGLNIFGLMVTNQLGSVFRAVLLTSRTASVSLSEQQQAASQECESL